MTFNSVSSSNGNCSGFTVPFDNRREGAADEFRNVMVRCDAGVFLEDLAFLAVGDVLLQGNQAFAAGQAKQVVEQLEQFLVGPAVEWGSLEALQHPLDQIDEDFLRRHDHQGAQRGPADHENFRGVNQRRYFAAGPDEAGQHASNDHDASGNNKHERFSG